MQSSMWAALLRHIPGEQHNNLMLVTAGGTEIAIQGILRIDHQFVALKGRLAGSQDSGRVFFIPFSHIDYLGFQKPVKDVEFREMFDDLSLPAPAHGAAGPEPAGAADGPAAGGASPGRSPAPIKSTVLEKFRQRSVTAPGTALRPPTDP
jgi:hypothetical protein